MNKTTSDDEIETLLSDKPHTLTPQGPQSSEAYRFTYRSAYRSAESQLPATSAGPLIYNELNVLITREEVESIINKFLDKKIEISNLDFYRISLTHKSYTRKAYIVDKNAIIDPKTSFLPKKKKYIINVELEKLERGDNVKVGFRKNSNERYEFYGDSIIHFVATKYLYTRYDDQDEGFLTKLRIKLENGEMISELARVIGLGKYIIMAKQIDIMGGRDSISILEDSFEAFIAAIYLDLGMTVCENFIVNVIEQSIDFSELLANDTNYKDQLLQYSHKMKWGTHPKYIDISQITQPDSSGKRMFKVYVTDKRGQKLGTGTGSSKKKAEQMAAYAALVKLNALKINEVNGKFKNV
jgi:dsRNA-specific ribonuclease